MLTFVPAHGFQRTPDLPKAPHLSCPSSRQDGRCPRNCTRLRATMWISWLQSCRSLSPTSLSLSLSVSCARTHSHQLHALTYAHSRTHAQTQTVAIHSACLWPYQAVPVLQTSRGENELDSCYSGQQSLLYIQTPVPLRATHTQEHTHRNTH